MKFARVFPTRTSMSPTDPDAYFGEPDLFTPIYDKVLVSITFTWDKEKGIALAKKWKRHGDVSIGGVAIDGESLAPFRPGEFLRYGITITSRGCPNYCDFCMVRHGRIIEYSFIPEGNIVQDNNLLACSNHHLGFVWEMLKGQKAIELKGGLESSRITPKIAETLRGLRIKSLWLACDVHGAIKPLQKAVELLTKAGFTRNHLFCYVLCGKNMAEEEDRLKTVFNMGCMPFAQLYRNEKDDIKYSKEWKNFARDWSRPAQTKWIMKNNIHFPR